MKLLGKLKLSLFNFLTFILFLNASDYLDFFKKACKYADINERIILLDECLLEYNSIAEDQSINEFFKKRDNVPEVVAANMKLHNNFFQILKDMKNLKILKLSNNSLKTLPKNSINHLTSIQEIEITNNLIERIEKETFDGLLNLRKINLNFNKIVYIDPQTFLNTTSLPNLLAILLVGNKLESIDVWPIVRGININDTYVNVGGNKIKTFSNELGWYFDCSMRKKYDFKFHYILVSNEIKYLNDFFKSIFKTEVDILCLRGRKFETNAVIEIDDNNPFVCDCVDGNYLTKLSWLTRRDFMVRARCIYPYFKKWMTLTENEMICPQTTVSCLDDCVCDKVNKISYRIVCSSLQTLPEKLPLRTLTTKYKNPYNLSLAKSNIKLVEDHNYFQDVKWLDISKNVVKKITSAALNSILNISTVYLHSNKLTTLPRVDAVNVKTKELSLHDNKWDCNCGNVWFKRWLQTLRSKNILIEPDSIFCHTPQWLENRTIFTIEEKDFCSNPNINEKTFLAAVLVPIFVLLLIIVVTYQLVRRFKVQLNTYLNIHPFDRDECLGEDMMFDAFIICSSEDRIFAIKLTKFLDQKGYRICYHEKNFPVGIPLRTIIKDVVIKTLERNKSINKNRLIVLLFASFEKVSQSMISDDVRFIYDYLKMYTYIEVDRCNKFINQLIYSMPLHKMGSPPHFE
ncbi:hypothetical protein HELRODRAFT_160742 [Helobdella robusta]|uniref:LRRCT domain-containing protein n=1 Tax=Helobdella robusta TaxID=6412 RepID=T1EQN5_HELRO|nr:hypothetical protein HELRODRAFT_160742 [Helobdella robusta]ESO06561.1 hypothetical protein HELRODRAFT_160742 [Helobdella robusta]